MLMPVLERVSIQFDSKTGAVGQRDNIVFGLERPALYDITDLPS
jgi:hypothetical protein